MSDLETLPLEVLVASRKGMAIVWTVEDVREIRSDLTAEQCWDVLAVAHRNHDATIGINWDVLACVADDLFGVSGREAS